METGARGEEHAARFLEGRGYRILCRNYRCPLGELDLVAEDSGMLAFVEVRTRRKGAMVRPEETVDWTKASRVARLAAHYLAAHDLEDRPWRIDVASVYVDSAGIPASVELFQDVMADLTRWR
jgi:putative endonuclease